jgi:glycogen debranching enzyme
VARADHVYLDLYAPDTLVRENTFIDAEPDRSFPPSFHESRCLLPEPSWDGHDDAVACYWKTWELAFRNLRRVHVGNRFIAPYIDTAFNDCLFMWDSAFILMFARYGRRAFDFQRTLDNFYAHQHEDGFIAREIREWDGRDRFHRHDPASTGPNVLPWCEWEYYLNYGDTDRLRRVFPPLLAYHRWMRLHRSWPDGSYWTCGLGCGMDNQPRTPPGCDCALHHGFMGWIDATAQAVLSARILLAAGEVLDRSDELDDLRLEADRLAALVNDSMWQTDLAFYVDRFRDGSLSSTRSVGAYWTLLAGIVPPDRLPPLAGHLEDEAEFNRPHRVPSLSADHPDYQADGGYWRGAVWPPTNYMVLRGLTSVGLDDLAARVARNHHDNVVRTFADTGTVWENYSPESAAPGRPAKPDFVGWGGLGPIAVMLEYVLGLRPDVPARRLVWDLRLTEAHAVRRYPYGSDGMLDLSAAARRSPDEEPAIEVSSNVDLDLVLRWQGGERTLHVS